MHTQTSVESRYADAALQAEAALCCPVDYDPQYLKVIPQEVIEKDYGCGDPSQWLKNGETVLDLGAGTGKIAFIASQVVGANGQVIGVDMTDAMLSVARRNAPIVAERIGYCNVDFRKGRIQDLALDLEQLDQALCKNPITSSNDLKELDALSAQLRREQPLIASESVDVVVSNCVLNLVESVDKPQLFNEIFRVLKKGGRAVISDIVSDEPIPEKMQQDAHLWSGCLSGALTESDFLKAFETAGFHGIELVKFESNPWQTIEGIEFRSITVQAFKGKQGPCREQRQAVIYQGPYKCVLDDDGHRYDRGVRTAVCAKTFQLLQKEPYAGHFAYIEPLIPVDAANAEVFDCERSALRHPRESKGQDYQATHYCSETEGCC
jgi:ubiquinone/menaquinone biosynthesis C-methylase UbiE